MFLGGDTNRPHRLLKMRKMLLAVCFISGTAHAALSPSNLQQMLSHPGQRAPVTPVSGTTEFVGYVPCEFPNVVNTDECTGPWGTALIDFPNISELYCKTMQLQADQFAGQTGTCQPQGSTWSFAGNCYPFVQLGISLGQCAADHFACEQVTIFGLPTTSGCCPSPGQAGICF